MPQPPPLRPKRRKHAPDVVLRASTNAAALGERQPVAGGEPEPDGEDENGAAAEAADAARDAPANGPAPAEG